MKEYHSKEIRNVAVLGHMGCGKTSFIESVLLATKTIDKKGSVERKNTVCDYTSEEQERQTTFISKLVSVDWKGTKINFIDTPGSEEFIGDISDVLSVVGAAVLVVDSKKGFEVGTEIAFEILKERNIPTFIFINKMDKENIKYDKIVEELKEKIGSNVYPFSYPIGEADGFKGLKLAVEKQQIIDDVLSPMEGDAQIEELYGNIVEAAAEADDELLEKFFNDVELTTEEVKKGIELSINAAAIYPLTCGSSKKDVAIKALLNMISDYLPAADHSKGKKATMADKTEGEIKVDENGALAAYVFKTIIDPFVGTINLFKIYRGSIATGQEVYISNIDKAIKMTQIFTLVGKQQKAVDKAFAGDIIAVAKINDLQTGYTISDRKKVVQFEAPEYPTPVIYLAISPKKKQDDEKISSALHKIGMEDSTFEVKRNVETAQLLIGGQGTTQINYIIEKMKNSFKVEVDIDKQKVVYRETIRGRTDDHGAHGRHKKQSGGAGQFGEVYIRFEPTEEEFEFGSVVVGGAVPKGYFPAVEKGLQKAFLKGPLAGFPVIGVKATLTDGSYHPVDSNELSFVLAANLAWKDAQKSVKPTILEPIYQVDVVVKPEYVGTVMGDMSKRRGRISDQQNLANGKSVIIAEVPEAEIVSYATELKAMTQASGRFSRKFLRYDPVPEDKKEKIIAENANKE